jgi:uncharacterized membrane protein
MVSLFLVLKLVHIGAAIVALGANLTYTYWLRRAGMDQMRILDALDGIHGLDRRVANPGYIVLLLTGLAMAWNVGYPLTTLWIAAAIVLYVLIAVLGIVVYAPAIRRQRAAAERDVTSAEYRAAASRSSSLGLFVIGAVVVILFLMVFKPTM